jgi:hypothetical protein
MQHYIGYCITHPSMHHSSTIHHLFILLLLFFYEAYYRLAGLLIPSSAKKFTLLKSLQLTRVGGITR